jgi:tRNA-Thr(GGU) m(6)t(6)A37 methyltransferase TsaA
VQTIPILPIGLVRGGRSEPVDDGWDAIRAEIVLDAQQFSSDALDGLDGFSHLEIVFQFDQVRPDQIITGARHPRGRLDWPRVGIFAQRGKARPNRLGVSICKLISVKGLVLTVDALDAIDGSPILDIKPVMRGFLPRGEIRQPDWADQIMGEYW